MLEMESIPFNLRNVLDHLKNLIVFQTAEKNIELVFKIQDDLPIDLVGDPLRLGQVLINLSSNAVKFTEFGMITISVTLKDFKNLTSGQAMIEFSVQDSGIGMTAEQIDRLFEAFSQGDRSTTRRFGGTGLGLFISKRIVEMMGGEISLESKENNGTTFYFSIPFCLQSPQLITSPEIPAKMNLVALSNVRILLAEDSILNQELAVELLSSEGLLVDVANNGQEAVELFIQNYELSPYDVVLMDIQMPVLDGPAATIEIRKWESEKKISSTAGIPIIAMTACAMHNERQKYMAGGMNDYITKPVDPDILYSTLLKWIRPEKN
ncbi:ATP-binding protein [Desulfobacterales bacterium HSG17]|nr:ATP-binding protein [Desulfobacterales bacterium HSG17]